MIRVRTSGHAIGIFGMTINQCDRGYDDGGCSGCVVVGGGGGVRTCGTSSHYSDIHKSQSHFERRNDILITNPSIEILHGMKYG